MHNITNAIIYSLIATLKSIIPYITLKIKYRVRVMPYW